MSLNNCVMKKKKKILMVCASVVCMISHGGRSLRFGKN